MDPQQQLTHSCMTQSPHRLAGVQQDSTHAKSITPETEENSSVLYPTSTPFPISPLQSYLWPQPCCCSEAAHLIFSGRSLDYAEGQGRCRGHGDEVGEVPSSTGNRGK